jgi:membrane fusion protein (multidrug efflux system)
MMRPHVVYALLRLKKTWQQDSVSMSFIALLAVTARRNVDRPLRRTPCQCVATFVVLACHSIHETEFHPMTSQLHTFALAGAIATALVACSKPEQQAMPTPEVGVIQAKTQTLPLQIGMVGRLSSFRSADVRARVSGVLQKRLYTEGTDVEEGQALFKIDPAPLNAALSSAQGQLASAQASHANAKVAADRARRLAPQQYVSQSDLDNAEATERTAAAALQQARAAVETARINLGYATVTAPISGRAGKQQVTEGALVGSSDVTLLTTVDQIDPLYVNFAVSSDELTQLRQAQSQGSVQLTADGKSSVEVMLGDGSKYAHGGTLDFSSVTVDPGTGAVTLRALLPNPERALLPGTFVTLQATLGQRSNAILLPQAAIQRDATGAYALVVNKDGKVNRKNVTAEGQQQNQWLITAGLQDGDQVIVDGVQKIKEGAPAKATPWKPVSVQSAAPAQQ